MIKALTVGSAMVDIIVLVADRDVERMTMHNEDSSFLLLEQGRKIEALAITDHSGGGAVNTAVSMARLGSDVSALIKIGRDRDGDRILGRLNKEGIGADCVVRTDELPTGTAVMVSSHDKNATIFTQRGANTLLREEDVDPEGFKGRDLVYVTNLSNKSADRFPDIVSHGREAGAFVAVNPGIRQLTSRTQAFIDCLGNIDFLALNTVEAEALVPAICARCDNPRSDTPSDPELPRLWQLGLEYGGFSIDVEAFISYLRSMGVGAVVITDGSQGAYLADGSGIYFCPTRRVEVQGTAGAGDAFSSTLSTSLVEGHTPAVAMQRAAINAASVVSKIDAQSGLMTASDIEAELRTVADELAVTQLA